MGGILALMLVAAFQQGQTRSQNETQSLTTAVLDQAVTVPAPVFTRVIPNRPKSNLEMGGFQQIGTLQGTSDGQKVILPLYQKPSQTNINRYHYHTKSDTYNSQPVAVQFQNRDCLSDRVGCNEIMEGDSVQVAAFDGDFAPYLWV